MTEPHLKYFLTFFEKLEETENSVEIGTKTCKGFFDTHNQAENVLHDIAKTKPSDDQTYAVIELYESGYSPICSISGRRFYKWDDSINDYTPISEDDLTKTLFNFAIN